MAKFNEVMERGRAKKLSPVVLAFVGDAAYSLFVREGLVLSSDYKTGELQKMSSAQVSAKGQASLFSKIEGKLTEEEREIFLRGRNAKSRRKARARAWRNTTFPRGSRRSSAFCTFRAIIRG